MVVISVPVPCSKVAKSLTICLLVGLASACTTTEELAKLQSEPGYIAGYSDGCATAREAEKSFSTKRVRDDNSYESDRAYRTGWRAGLLQCDYPEDDKTSVGGRILGEDQNF